eukprot:TRINITY_DN1502_c0_g1_i1.p1 TRINITY_DN1502_c0_g1~~TRINITY_DN1502_c0_g1_i1.p1  ORF type:complete len:458 (-),score=36.87 TRINITY_DN1502_c0_g1_i1:1209-2378(-)
MIRRDSEFSRSKYLKREVLNHRQLVHPHIVSLNQVLLSQNHLCMVMEFVDGQDLHTYVKKNGPLSEDTARWFFQQQILGLDYCHRMGIVNRDLKLENCLISQPDYMTKPILKLCDFGFSKMPDQQSNPKSRVGTLQYMAPEVIRSAVFSQPQAYDGYAADVWSCGTMLYAMLFRKFPFQSTKNAIQQFDKQQLQEEIFHQILEAELVIPDNISSDCQHLLTQMMDRNPNTRISVSEVMRHPWFIKGLPKGFLSFNQTSIDAQKKGQVQLTCQQDATEIENLINAAFLGFRQHSPLEVPGRASHLQMANSQQLYKLIAAYNSQQQGYACQQSRNKSCGDSQVCTVTSLVSSASAELVFKREASVKLTSRLLKKILTNNLVVEPSNDDPTN